MPPEQSEFPESGVSYKSYKSRTVLAMLQKLQTPDLLGGYSLVTAAGCDPCLHWTPCGVGDGAGKTGNKNSKSDA